MMLPTHAVVGAAIGLCLGFAAPQHTAQFIALGTAAGALPDLDMFFDHRRTLHFPIGAIVVGLFMLSAYLIVPGPLLPAAAIVFFAMGVHGAMDLLGGGKELRPWEEYDDRAVYDHMHHHWLHPKRWIYDGSPLDFAILVITAVPVYLFGPRIVQAWLIPLIFFGALWTIFRHKIASRIPQRFPTLSSYLQFEEQNLLDRIRRKHRD